MSNLIEIVARQLAAINSPASKIEDNLVVYRVEAAFVLRAIEGAGYEVGPGWQPIETAPRDGTHVLIFVPKSERWPVREVSWALEYEAAPGYWMTTGSAVGRGFIVLPEQATHWRPLPAPPAFDAAPTVGEAE